MLVAACAVYAQIPNVSGRVTSTDGSPVAGAVVSDGLNCTQTDSDGRYTLTSDLENRHFIMLSVPAEYEIPARHSLPIPFKRIPRYVETFTADFVLEPRKESSDHHTLIVQGDPQIKGKRKQLHQEMLSQNTLGNVRKAKVLVTNPTHYAVALDYEKDRTPLPIILAKGEGFLAQRMMQVAREEGIPIMRNVPLARSLFESGTENAYIPKDLIGPVAEVLRWVQSLQLN